MAEVSVLPVANISAGGMLVRLEGNELRDVSVGEEVSVFLDVTDLPEPISVTLGATVVRLNGVSSVALRWTTTDSRALALLERLLAYVATRA